jgi:hypothetical protein
VNTNPATNNPTLFTRAVADMHDVRFKIEGARWRPDRIGIQIVLVLSTEDKRVLQGQRQIIESTDANPAPWQQPGVFEMPIFHYSFWLKKPPYEELTDYLMQQLKGKSFLLDIHRDFGSFWDYLLEPWIIYNQDNKH